MRSSASHSQRLRQANAFMANAIAPDRQPASTANDSQEERGASHCCCDPRATQTAGFAGSRYRSRWRSIKFHAAAKGLWVSVNVYTGACFGRP